MLLDDLLEHLNCLVSLICQDKNPWPASLARLRRPVAVRERAIQRDGFLELLGGCVVIGYVLKDARIIPGMFPAFLKISLVFVKLIRLGL